MVKFILLPAIIAVILHQIEGQCFTTKDDKEPKQIGRKSLYGGEQEFSLNLLRDINQLNPEGNIFFSPYSTYHALLLAYFISAGKTEQFLKKALRLDPGLFARRRLRILQRQPDLCEHGDKSQRLRFRLVHGRIREHRFRNETGRIPSDHQQMGRESNAQYDQGPVAPGSIDQTTNLALVNAGYFKGSWKYEFKESETKEEVFHVSPEKRVLVKMMHMEAMLNHDVSEELGAYVLELPYKGEKISMYILLPPFMKQDGIAKTLAKLTPSTFQKVMQNLTNDYGKTVNLQLPKFSLENTIEMTPILESLGVGNLFTSEADFSFLSDSHLTLGAGVHKAKIVVNEKGSEAAAASALIGVRTMDDETVTYRCNHPFMFLLYSKETSTIAFIGIVRNPEQFLSL
ncbi:serine protease inhibitor serpin [Holotrichia oblita]|uniref:Serine protease inhibitor serpin n=1 Tax=Holotrichia oblita TaxID=644536 RepID=A0ACB9THI2_HOLOL|nr:serine protease inhibitor serpin [Holotrichia oblita]